MLDWAARRHWVAAGGRSFSSEKVLEFFPDVDDQTRREWGIVVASIENQQALTDDTCARVRDRVEPHGHPVARLFPTNLRSGLGIGPKFCVHHIDMTICYGYICV